jgi:hypothetical protein
MKIITAVVVFEETKVKPGITLSAEKPYEIVPTLQTSLEREIVGVLRQAWCWGKRME